MQRDDVVWERKGALRMHDRINKFRHRRTQLVVARNGSGIVLPHDHSPTFIQRHLFAHTLCHRKQHWLEEARGETLGQTRLQSHSYSPAIEWYQNELGSVCFSRARAHLSSISSLGGE